MGGGREIPEPRNYIMKGKKKSNALGKKEKEKGWREGRKEKKIFKTNKKSVP